MLGGLLDRPFAQARWRWFADPHHQLTATSNFDPQTHEEIASLANVTTRLRENCRNTAQIVRAVEYASGVPLGSTRVRGAGPDVVYGQATDAEGLAAEAAKQVRSWLQEGDVAPAEIMMLSPRPIGESQVPRIAARLGLSYKRWRRGWDKTGSMLGASTIEEFRGLESPFVVLCDIGGSESELARLLYLGMTRANFGVFVACERASRERLVSARAAALAAREG